MKKITKEKRKNGVELFERNSSAFLKVLEDCDIIGFSFLFGFSLNEGRKLKELFRMTTALLIISL